MLEYFATNAAVIAGLMLLVWLVSVWKRDASIVDPIWGLGFVVVTAGCLLQLDAANSRSWLLLSLASCWGVRLSLYLGWRNWGEPEDYRYRQMRERHGHRFPLVSLFTVFLLQGLVMWVVSLPLQMGVQTPPSAGWPIIVLAGVLVWGVGVFFESVGDWQLARFRADPSNAGKLFDRGLWSLTRHPNYFGDFCVWWGLYLVSFGDGRAWWTIVGPIVMSVFLMKFSGVGLLEKSLSSSKPGFAEYVARTNAFFPGWPRKLAGPRKD